MFDKQRNIKKHLQFKMTVKDQSDRNPSNQIIAAISGLHLEQHQSYM